MQDEHPLEEAREAITEENSSAEGSMTAPKRSSGLLIAGVVVVVLLIVAGLFLPPISLGERLGLGGGDEAVEANVTAIPEGSLEIPGEAALTLTEGAEAALSRLSQADFLAGSVDEAWRVAAQALPSNGELKSSVFVVQSEGPVGGVASLVIPADAAPVETLDLYGWDGDAWRFVPSRVDTANQRIQSLGGELPQALALMQIGEPESVSVAAQVEPGQTLSAGILAVLTDVSVGGLRLEDAGTVSGDPADVPAGGYRQWLGLTNRGAIVDQASLEMLLEDEGLQAALIGDLAARVEAGGYTGVHLDLIGAPANLRAAYSSFVANLAATLHGAGSRLAVTLGMPALLGNGSWDTGAQDPEALGQQADLVFLQLPLNPGDYADGGMTEQLLAFATRQIDRGRMLLLASASSIEGVGEAYRELSSNQALANFGTLSFVQGSEEVEPGDAVEVALSGSASPLEWDGTGVAYKYSYEANNSPHTVWLGNEAALNHRLRFGLRYRVGGVALRSPGDAELGSTGLAALRSYLGAGDAPVPQGAAIVWTVLNEAGGIQANSNGESLAYSWQAPEEPGTFVVRADFAQGEVINTLGEVNVVVASPVVEEPPAEEPAQAETLDEGQAAEEPADEGSTAAIGDVSARVNTAANVRSGPGLGYQVIAGVEQGTSVAVTGRNSGSNWLQVLLPDDKQGWIFAQLLDVTGDIAGLAVIEVDPPVASAPSAGGTTPAPAPAPAPVIAPAPAGSFQLGGQTHSLAHPAQMLYTGMTWVKFQHKWGPGDSPNAVQGRIDSAHANGFKVLLSIPGANTYPSSIDFTSYVEFLRGVAALGPDAIEIWNEMNIDFEWPAGAIDPASYVNNMLAPAYNAIKAANPNVMVISGAPAPTGYFGGGCGANGCDDNAYLAGMAAAGAASYMDCVGVHHNAGATSPTVSSGHPAGGTHYSWYFQPTMDLYYNAFGGSRPVCFTELGYLSGQDFGGVPSRFSWAGNTTVAQHAQWLAEAVSLAANSGKVRMLIVFNVDFTYYADDPQAGFAMIRPDGSCPSCDLLANIMGSR